MVLLAVRITLEVNQMLNEDTKRKLYELRLNGMADALAFQEQDKEYRTMNFMDRMTLLIDAEYSRQKSAKLDRLIKAANFSNRQAALEDIEYHPDRKLDKELILRLKSGSYLNEHHNLILMGASGNGKTWLANAFGIEACRQGHKVRYIRLPELIDALTIAKNEADGSFRKILNRYKKVDLLILDEWLLTSLSLEQATFLLELIEARLQTSSTIFCSQFSPEGWHEKLGNPQIADAILDRIVHDSYSILIDGRVSMRERHSLVNES